MSCIRLTSPDSKYVILILQLPKPVSYNIAFRKIIVNRSLIRCIPHGGSVYKKTLPEQIAPVRQGLLFILYSASSAGIRVHYFTAVISACTQRFHIFRIFLCLGIRDNSADLFRSADHKRGIPVDLRMIHKHIDLI